MFSRPKLSAPAVASPPSKPVGTADSSSATPDMTAAQKAAALQGGTVYGSNTGSPTTKTLLGQ